MDFLLVLMIERCARLEVYLLSLVVQGCGCFSVGAVGCWCIRGRRCWGFVRVGGVCGGAGECMFALWFRLLTWMIVCFAWVGGGGCIMWHSYLNDLKIPQEIIIFPKGFDMS